MQHMQNHERAAGCSRDPFRARQRVKRRGREVYGAEYAAEQRRPIRRGRCSGYRENRTSRVPKHIRCDRSAHRAGKAGAAVRRHDNQVGWEAGRQVDDLICRVSAHGDGLGRWSPRFLKRSERLGLQLLHLLRCRPRHDARCRRICHDVQPRDRRPIGPREGDGVLDGVMREDRKVDRAENAFGHWSPSIVICRRRASVPSGQ
jgi:hypothetical protein